MISRRLLRIKVMQVYYANLQRKNNELSLALRELDSSVHNTLELYYELVAIITYMADFSEQKIQTALEKRLPNYEDLHPNKRFVENPVINSIRETGFFQKFTGASRIPLDAHSNLVKTLWEMFSSSTAYNQYMNKEKVSLQDHKEIINFIVREYFPDNEELDSLIEEYCIYWNDDIGFVASILEKSISRYKKSGNNFLITNEYSCDDDRDFGIKLLKNALIYDSDFENIIDEHSKNWDIERIAMLDKIIMKLAVTEFIYMPEVPVKVTINEYIEISKYYSTAKSNAFINGLLDQIVHALKDNNKLKKTGRGLVE